MGMESLLNIGRTALNTAQYGLQVVGNNIANVNTPNYSRQRAIMTPGVTSSIGGNSFGTGVEVDQVVRIYDRFLGYQASTAFSDLEDYTLREQIYSRVDSILYPSDESDLNYVMNNFFSAWSDLANGNPDGTAERQVVLSKGEMVASTLNGLYTSLNNEMQYFNVYYIFTTCY